MFDKNVTSASGRPCKFCRLKVSTNGVVDRPAVSLAEGGSQNGVPFNTIANR